MARKQEDFSGSPVSTTSQPNVSQSPSDGDGNSNTSVTKQVIPPSHTSPVSAFTTPRLNTRSCISCRKRKVGCNKKHPCAHCSRSGTECIFPGPGRAPRRNRKPPDTEMLARLKRLEGLVQTFSNNVETDLTAEPLKPPAQEIKVEEKFPSQSECLGLHNADDEDSHLDVGIKEFGRLSIEGGRSRYVSNKFWVTLSEEVAEMRDLLDDQTDDEGDYPSTGSGYTAAANHQAFMFGFQSTALSLEEHHPAFVQVVTYWDIFKENVDPLIKIFHRPLIDAFIRNFDGRYELLSKTEEVMMFTIYFAVITSMSEEQCTAILGVQRNPTLEKYRFAVEQALARAEFLSTQEIVVLQSFTLFLTCVRRIDDSRYVWTLTGLVIRIAQSMGMHRDGKQFDLPPFETEMRRRLWWQICSLDVRASEDHGSDPSIGEQSFDTKFPLNINDDDIFPGMKNPPVEREGRTEMMFDLIRYTVSTTVRRLSYAPPGQGPWRTKSDNFTLEDKERIIEELHQVLENKYLKYCDMTNPLDWVSATLSRLIMAKMWLIVHHPLQRDDGGAGLPEGTQDRLFLTSIEVIEFSRLLQTEQSTLKWNWLFRTYVQWHAVAFVLSQLCKRISGPVVERAWAVVDSVFDEWAGSLDSSRKGMLWSPLRKLMTRARLVRANALERQSKFPLDGSLGPSSNGSLMQNTQDPMQLVNDNLNQDSFPSSPETMLSTNNISNVSNENVDSYTLEFMQWMNSNGDQYPSSHTSDTTHWMNSNSSNDSPAYTKESMQWTNDNANQLSSQHAPESIQWTNPSTNQHLTTDTVPTTHSTNLQSNGLSKPPAPQASQIRNIQAQPQQHPQPPNPPNGISFLPFTPSPISPIPYTNNPTSQLPSSSSSSPLPPTTIDPQWNINPHAALMGADEGMMWLDSLVSKEGALDKAWYS